MSQPDIERAIDNIAKQQTNRHSRQVYDQSIAPLGEAHTAHKPGKNNWKHLEAQGSIQNIGVTFTLARDNPRR